MTWLRSFMLLSVVFVLLIFSEARAQFKLTLNFENMDPHVGQMLELRVVDKATGLEVGRARIASIAQANFSLELYVLKENQSYQIDFYADFNQNGQYDAPPTDHAWRLQVDNAQQDVSLTFSHNTNFTDIQWPGPLSPAQFAGDWAGTWTNLTFNTTGPIWGSVEIMPQEQTIKGAFKATGAFGNPDTTVFAFEGNLNATSDTAQIVLPDPWSGSVILTAGQITGSITDPTLFGSGLTLKFTGTLGLSQAIFTYAMSGAFQANGVILLSHPNIPTAVRPGQPANLPAKFALLPNFPNPFNPGTRIRFVLPQAAPVTLKVFNLLGKEVATLAQGMLSAGEHTVKFEAKGLPAGLYFYQLKTPTRTQTQAMQLVK